MEIESSDCKKFLNNEIADSIEDICKKRLTSPLYGVFLISWVVFHWNFIFTMLFVSEDKIWEATRMLKNDYLLKTFCNYSDWKFYLFWILPLLMTYLVIWWFPSFFSLPAYKKEEEYKTEKRKIKIKELKKIKTVENDLEKENIKSLDLETKKSEKEKKIEKLDPTRKWKMEYISFRANKYFKDFNFILMSIYEGGGKISWYGDGRRIVVPKNILAYSHSNNIINIDEKSGTVSLTEKGKFFVKEYTLEKDNNFIDEMPF